VEIPLAVEAIQCWSMIGRRLRVVRDIRILISKLLWNERNLWV